MRWYFVRIKADYVGRETDGRLRTTRLVGQFYFVAGPISASQHEDLYLLSVSRLNSWIQQNLHTNFDLCFSFGELQHKGRNSSSNTITQEHKAANKEASKL
jgi:hypothetical protein